MLSLRANSFCITATHTCPHKHQHRNTLSRRMNAGQVASKNLCQWINLGQLLRHTSGTGTHINSMCGDLDPDTLQSVILSSCSTPDTHINKIYANQLLYLHREYHGRPTKECTKTNIGSWRVYTFEQQTAVTNIFMHLAIYICEDQFRPRKRIFFGKWGGHLDGFMLGRTFQRTGS